jgi:ELWxxDGT repeat protein
MKFLTLSLIVPLFLPAVSRVHADLQSDSLILSETSPAPVQPHFTQAGSRLVFTAHSDSAGLELWSTDGTRAGTAPLLDHNPVTSGSKFGSFTRFQDAACFFVENTAATGDELWKSDGTSGGTEKLADFAGGVPGVHGGAVLGGALYFCAPGDSELWKSNGTAAGTVKVKDLTRDFIVIPGPPAELLTVAGRVFIASRNMGLYVSDGSAGGTVKLTTSTQATLLTAVGSGIVFRGAAVTGSSGELWKSDGTAAGTTPLKAPGNVTVSPGEMLST